MANELRSAQIGPRLAETNRPKSLCNTKNYPRTRAGLLSRLITAPTEVMPRQGIPGTHGAFVLPTFCRRCSEALYSEACRP